jgi:hypothetical protein
VAGTHDGGFSGDGGPATGADLDRPSGVTPEVPSGVAVDGAGNLLIADSSNNRIREVAG